ncbi:MAG: glycosyltransferase [Verrucomicrobiota bacterium]
MKLRILHALPSVNPAEGGPVEGVRQLTKVNQRFGHNVEIVCLDAPDAPWLANAGARVHALGPGYGRYGYAPRYVPWLRENARNYDCVIVNGIWQYHCYGTWLALKKSRVPYCVFPHGMLDPWFKHRYPLKHLKKWLYWPWGVYPVLRDARAVFFTCEEEQRLARESFWLYDCDEIALCYGTEGVPDPARDYRPAFFKKHESLRDRRLLLFLGRVHPKKGPDLLIRAVGQLRRAGKWDPALRVVMAGPADGDYAEHLRALARREGIADCVYWTGLVLGDEKWGAFQAAEAFVLPSHQENFGIAVVEALSAGTPVLLSRQVNIWPEISADGAGLDGDDTVAGCRALLERWLALSPATRQTMRRQAVETFRQRYTADTAARSLIARLYLMIAHHFHAHPRSPGSV